MFTKHLPFPHNATNQPPQTHGLETTDPGQAPEAAMRPKRAEGRVIGGGGSGGGVMAGSNDARKESG